MRFRFAFAKGIGSVRRFTLTAFVTVLPLAITVAHPASADVLIKVDKNDQRMAVSVDGQTRYVWPVSTGTTGYETPSGAFRVSRLERTYFSRKYDNAPMPHAIFFTAHGHAIHGTTQGRNLGRPASHGCIRLSLRNAATLFSIVRAEGMSNVRIVVGGDALAVANRNGTGFRQARRLDRYDRDSVMSAGAQMGVENGHSYYRPTNRRRSNDAYFYPDYGYAPVYSFEEY